jgi:toxin-antitoxin system PIN domain toxin
MTVLLDSSVLIALNVGDHVHHDPAASWFTAFDDGFATCPITQGALIRHLLRSEQTAADALRLLSLVEESPRHEFWPDDLSYGDVRLAGVDGHRQVTDAYLAQLARHHTGRVATFDKGFVALHGDVAELVPVGS